jgi:hypothetical protein
LKNLIFRSSNNPDNPFFMKHNFTKKLTLICVFALGSLGLYAVDYCHTPLTSNDGTATIYLTCQNLSENLYQIKIESDVDMTGLGGSHCHINGTEVYQMNAAGRFVVSDDKKTITLDITSTTAPSVYTPLFVIMSGEKVFTWPADVSWAICAVQPDDNTPPVMGTATVNGTPGATSVVLDVTATDDITNPVNVFQVSINADAPIVVCLANAGQITVSSLTPETSYALTIQARDGAGNVSANSATVAFTTTAIPLSPCAGDKGHFGTPDNTKIHYTISYENSVVTYTVTSLTTDLLDLMEIQTTVGSFAGTITNGVGVYSHSGLTVGDLIGIRILYSLENMGGNEMTSNDITLADPNIIIYKVGNCVSTVMTETTAGQPAFVLYPNPVNDVLTVTAGSSVSRVTVHNLLGQTLMNVPCDAAQVTLDVRALAAGNYIIKAYLSNGESYTEKFSKGNF